MNRLSNAMIRILLAAACAMCLSCRRQPGREAPLFDGGETLPSSTDSHSGTVPITCAAPRVCLEADVCHENDGTIVDSLECDINGVCCDLLPATDTDTDSAVQSDTAPPAATCTSPYGCAESEVCEGKGGRQVSSLTCEDPEEICCDLGQNAVAPPP